MLCHHGRPDALLMATLLLCGSGTARLATAQAQCGAGNYGPGGYWSSFGGDSVGRGTSCTPQKLDSSTQSTGATLNKCKELCAARGPVACGATFALCAGPTGCSCYYCPSEFTMQGNGYGPEDKEPYSTLYVRHGCQACPEGAESALTRPPLSPTQGQSTVLPYNVPTRSLVDMGHSRRSPCFLRDMYPCGAPPATGSWHNCRQKFYYSSLNDAHSTH